MIKAVVSVQLSLDTVFVFRIIEGVHIIFVIDVIQEGMKIGDQQLGKLFYWGLSLPCAPLGSLGTDVGDIKRGSMFARSDLVHLGCCL